MLIMKKENMHILLLVSDNKFVGSNADGDTTDSGVLAGSLSTVFTLTLIILTIVVIILRYHFNILIYIYGYLFYKSNRVTEYKIVVLDKMFHTQMMF